MREVQVFRGLFGGPGSCPVTRLGPGSATGRPGIGTAPQISLFHKLEKLTGANGANSPAWMLSHPKTPQRIAANEANEAKWRES